MNDAQDPLVSVIIATYNRGSFIKKTIDSVLVQTYPAIEIIVLDGGSTDNTKEVLAPYIQKGSILYRERTGLTHIVARDVAIDQSHGAYIAIVDSDDYWIDHDKIKKQVEFLEKNKDYVLVGGGMMKINGEGKEFARSLPPETDKQIREKILLNNMMTHSTVLFRRDTFFEVGGYAKKEGLSMKTGEDWNLYLKMGAVGKLYNFQEYFVNYLEAGQNMSLKNIRGQLRRNIEIRKQHAKEYPHAFVAQLLGWAYFLYAFVPGRKYMDRSMKKIRKFVLNY